jgi:hypothetical protein
MGWFLRKSLRVLPGIRLNLSKTGPRLSIGVPGARASIDTHGKTRGYAGEGSLRYQKSINIEQTQTRIRNAMSYLIKAFRD